MSLMSIELILVSLYYQSYGHTFAGSDFFAVMECKHQFGSIVSCLEPVKLGYVLDP